MSDVGNKGPADEERTHAERGASNEVGHLQEGEEQAPPGVRIMAIIRWALVAVMALAALFSILHYSGALERRASGDSATQYFCPMHPSVVQDQPGLCPICSMTLVPRQKEPGGNAGPAAAGDQPSPSAQPSAQPSSQSSSQPSSRPAAEIPGLAPITLTPERIQLLGMRTARATKAPLAAELRTVGFVTANEDGQAQITTRFAGWIEHLSVSRTGQHVSRGQVLASIYSPEVLAAESEYLNARRWGKADKSSEGAGPTEVAGALADDARRKLELLGISEEEIRQLEERGTTERAIKIRSAVSGHVTRKNAVRGAYVQPGTELFEIADLSSVWVLADVYEHELSHVSVGDEAKLEVAAYPARSFAGRLGFIYPVIDPKTRTARVRLSFDNQSLVLRPGMYADVIIARPAKEALIVPAEAVVDSGTHQYVFLARDGGRFEPKSVRTGERARDQVQILEGLDEGDVVVTTSNFLIDSESRLRAAISGGAAEDRAPAMGGGKGAGQGPSCEADFDKTRQADKYDRCRACEVQHRGMAAPGILPSRRTNTSCVSGTMQEDCKKTIPKPWR